MPGSAAPQTDSGHVDAVAGTLTGLFDFRHPRSGRILLDPSTGLPSGDDHGDGDR